MRQAAMKVFLSVAFLLLVGLVAQGQYTRPKPTAEGGVPTDADIVLYNGASNTLTVQLLNLTPYNIEFTDSPGITWSITNTDKGFMQDGSHTAKSFMFVPAGIPTLIPAAPEQNFVPKYLWDDYGNLVPNPDFDSNYKDKTTHPYGMVFAWDDRGGFVVDNWVKWTIRDVKYLCDRNEKNCLDQRDVGLGLWMYRNEPTSPLSSGALPVIVNSLKTTFETCALFFEPENPIAWMKAFLAVVETAKTATEFAKENTQENDGAKMWVASYVIPHPDSNCVRWQKDGTGKCEPAPLTADDAVLSEWTGNVAGPCYEIAGTTTCPDEAAEGELAVSVHVLRGKKAKQCDPLYYPNMCPLGSEPVVMITVMRVGDYVAGSLAGAAPNPSLGEIPTDKIRLFLLQAGAGKIRELLQKQGRPGLLMLRSLVAGLDPAQRQVLREMVRTMGSGRLPTQQERQLVHLLADELKTRLK